MSSTNFVNGSTLSDAGWANDVDTFVYSRLTSVSGTNTVVGTGPVSMTGYATGQRFTFIPAATNTGATTLNITPSGSSALGAKNIYWNGSACVGGEIKINVPCEVFYDGTQFNIMNGGPPLMSQITNSISGDVALNNTANYFDGPSVAQGTVGTWFASGSVTVDDTGGAANIYAKLWDGTTVIASGAVQLAASSQRRTISLSGFITSPAANIRISCRDANGTTGVILYNQSGESKDSTITAIRIG